MARSTPPGGRRNRRTHRSNHVDRHVPWRRHRPRRRGRGREAGKRQVRIGDGTVSRPRRDLHARPRRSALRQRSGELVSNAIARAGRVDASTGTAGTITSRSSARISAPVRLSVTTTVRTPACASPAASSRDELGSWAGRRGGCAARCSASGSRCREYLGGSAGPGAGSRLFARRASGEAPSLATPLRSALPAPP